MTGESRFISDRRGREEASWADEEDWNAGAPENVGVTADGLVGRAPTQDGEAPDSGVSRWTFDNEDTSGSAAIDSWGGNDGSISTGVSTGTSGANQTYGTNEAYYLNGDGEVNCGTITEVQGLNSMTLAAWVKYDSIRSFNSSIAMHTQNDDGWGFTHSDNSSIRFRCETNGSHASSRTVSINLGQWYHAVGVFDDNEGRMYLNGTLAAGPDVSNDITVTSVNDPFCIGNQKYRSSRDIPMGVDDVRIYSKALSDTEIFNLYNTGRIN
ncbi:LamG domain-containing protein [Halorubrum sp. AJ67]|uniref:LamG domain-containing protein n=1 Tax=Halorubrum sp. AJ67 TaxID=1173487 RepID=UPI0009AE38EB|nr:LamG domain-containing protein [Halorubrum sp. AJ67]